MTNESEPNFWAAILSVTGASWLLLLALFRFIVGRELRHNTKDHDLIWKEIANAKDISFDSCEKLEVRLRAVELNIPMLATRDDIKGVHIRMDTWNRDRVVRNDIVSTNQNIDETKEQNRALIESQVAILNVLEELKKLKGEPR